MTRMTVGLAVVTLAGAVLVSAGPAGAADFCSSRISGSSYYQKDFSRSGSVVATICAPDYNRAGNAYLYARGSYASVSKYMKLTIRTVNSTTVSADGNFYEYVYRARPAGLHTYSAIMRNAAGTTIVDGSGSDYE